MITREGDNVRCNSTCGGDIPRVREQVDCNAAQLPVGLSWPPQTLSLAGLWSVPHSQPGDRPNARAISICFAGSGGTDHFEGVVGELDTLNVIRSIGPFTTRYVNYLESKS